MSKKDADHVTNLLMKKVKKDVGLNIPRYNTELEDNKVQQADLLTLPNNRGFKYLLVVVDLGSRLCDAQPLRSKAASSVKNAFVKLYERGILKMPLRMEVDGGPEFKSDVAHYFKNNNCFLRVGLPGRHKQQAIVERYNQLISVPLFKYMISKQLLSKKINGQWIDNYRSVINAINKKAPQYKSNIVNYDYPVVQKNTNAVNLLDIGSYVLTALDEPRETTGSKLHGIFRATDIRYDPNLKIIRSIVLKPGVPPLYLVSKAYNDDIIHAGYTRNQLLLLSPDDVKALKKLKY